MLTLIAAIAILILIIFLILFLLKKVSGSEKSDQQEEARESSSQSEQRPLISSSSTTNNSYRNNNSSEALIRTETNTAIYNNNNATQQTEIKPLTKKDQLKMEKKKAKQDSREYSKMLLEEKKFKEEAREKDYLDREMKREDERRQEEEMLRKLKEEQEKKENAVYDQWKDQIAIAEEGEEMADINNEDLINDFINYIKLRKVVSLEDLSGVFKINPNDIVDRLNFLESQGRISGIVDDRGKYILITEKEVSAIEKIFMQRGRISKAELIKECNKIIRFTPTDEDKQIILEEQNKVWKSFEEEMDKNAGNNPSK